MGNFITNYFKDALDDKAHDVFLHSKDIHLNSPAKFFIKSSASAAGGHFAGIIMQKLLDYASRNGGNLHCTLYVKDYAVIIKPRLRASFMVTKSETIEIPYKNIIELRKKKADFLSEWLFILTDYGNIELLVRTNPDIIATQINAAKTAAG